MLNQELFMSEHYYRNLGIYTQTHTHTHTHIPLALSPGPSAFTDTSFAFPCCLLTKKRQHSISNPRGFFWWSKFINSFIGEGGGGKTNLWWSQTNPGSSFSKVEVKFSAAP